MANQPALIPKNFIDKALEYIAPAIAFRRQTARAAMALTGGYSGAKLGRNSLANWHTTAGSPEADISYDLPKLRERSRDLTRNSPIAVGAVALSVTNTIGTGLSLEPACDYEYLGLTEAEASQWAANVKREWKLWANSKDADISRHLNFYQLQALVYRSRMESGDVFVLLPTKKRGNAYDLVLQVIEADRICNQGFKNNTSNMIDGIEVDEHGAPIRYHIASDHPGGMRRNSIKWVAVDAYGGKGRRNVLHIYKQFRPGQVRGVPDFAPIIEVLKQLSRYTEAELNAAVTSAMFSIFVKMEQDAFEGLFDDAAKEAIVGSAKSWDGNIDANGKAVNLLPGESIETVNPGRPNAEFDPFVQAGIRQIGMALEIPYEVLIMHFQSSYSAARGAMLTAWRKWRSDRDWMATDLCQPVYELFLTEAVAKGRVQARGFFADPAVKAAWCSAQWVGDGPGSIDPVKEVAAARDRVDLGISTLAAESILHDGQDWETKHTQRVKEQAARVAGGLIQENTQAPASVDEPLQDGFDENGDPIKPNNAIEEAIDKLRAEQSAANVLLTEIASKEVNVQITTGDTHVTIPEREVKVDIAPANTLITNNLPESVTHLEAKIDLSDSLNSLETVIKQGNERAHQDAIMPRKPVFDSNGNPIGIVPVDKLE
jgi:lambda family phage portal protein